jgi:3-dehydroquinate dehydratase type I
LKPNDLESNMICIPIIASNTSEALAKIAIANPVADILEIRLDLMDTFDLDEIIQAAGKPLLATYRSKREGGKGSTDPEICTRHILSALHAGADLVDVELWLPQKWRHKIFDARGRSGTVISIHVQDSTPSQEELEKIFSDCTATGADIVKIVTRAKAWEDNLRVLKLIPKAHECNVKIIAFCMGSVGKISRIYSHIMGGYLTFATLQAGDESADGQMPVMEMKNKLKMFTS